MAKIKTKFTGVYYNLLQDNDRAYYVTYKNADNKKVWLKIGKYSEGVREAYCNQKRIEILNLQRLGEEPPQAKKYKKRKITTLESVATKYFLERKDTKSKEVDLSVFNNHIVIYFDAKCDIETVDKSFVLKYTKYLDTVKSKHSDNFISDKTKNNILSLLISIINYALKNDLIKNDFIKYIQKEDIDNNRERFLSKDEILELYERVSYDTTLLLFCKLLLTTGARLNTILSITKQDIDINHKIITLTDFKNKSTYKSFLTDEVIELLNQKTTSLLATDKLFSSNPQKRLLSILNELFNYEVDRKDTKNKVVIHTLRHTFASHLAINGTPILTIQKLMNHKDIKMTLRYAKLSPDTGRESINDLGF
jgi:integrase